MCLAVPVKVVEIGEDRKMAKVEMDGVKLDVSSVFTQDIKLGDYVLIHAGFIIEKLTQEDAQEKFELFQEYYEKSGSGPKEQQ